MPAETCGPTFQQRSTDIISLIRRKITLLTLLVLVTVVFAAAVVGTIATQNGTTPKDALEPIAGDAENGTTLKDALEPIERDAEVVATVQGIKVNRGDIRQYAEFWMMTDSSLTSDDATHQNIVLVIDRFISQAEIERRQLIASRKEAEDYMRPIRELCLGEHGAECREAIARLGFNPNSDEYWENIALPEYGKALSEIKLFRAVIIERDMEDATDEELIALRNALPGESRENAVVVWHDEDLERTYQSALRSE